MTYAQKFKNINPIAVMGLTNTMGVAIFECTDEYVISAFYNSNNYTNYRKTKLKGLCNIEYAYFTRYGVNYKLEDFVKTV